MKIRIKTQWPKAPVWMSTVLGAEVTGSKTWIIGCIKPWSPVDSESRWVKTQTLLTSKLEGKHQVFFSCCSCTSLAVTPLLYSGYQSTYSTVFTFMKWNHHLKSVLVQTVKYFIDVCSVTFNMSVFIILSVSTEFKTSVWIDRVCVCVLTAFWVCAHTEIRPFKAAEQHFKMYSVCKFKVWTLTSFSLQMSKISSWKYLVKKISFTGFY